MEPKRHYQVSLDPVFASDFPGTSAGFPASDDRRKDILFKLYDNVNTNWRSLVDIRFRLLTQVPSISLLFAGILVYNGAEAEKVSFLAKTLYSGLALVFLTGLFVYNLRNDDLHDELISRARRIEHELGIGTGAFMGRPDSKNPFINHSVGLCLAYLSAYLALGSAFLLNSIGWIKTAF